MILVSTLYPIGLIISNILTIALPSKLASFTSVHKRVHNWLHTFRIRRIGLHEVYEIQSISLIFARVLYSEVEPLGETLGAVVVFDIQVVFEWSDLTCFTQITAFEPGLKNERFICR